MALIPPREDALSGGFSTSLSDSRGEKRPLPRGTAAYPRKRAVTACQVCRARRTKCDNRKPSCSFCLKVGAECIQSPVDLSSFDPASIQIIERLNQLQSAVGRCETGIQHLAGGRKALSAENFHGSEISSPQSTSAPIDWDRLLPPSIEIICRWPTLGLAGTEYLLSTSTTSPGHSERESTVSMDDLQPRLMRALVDRFFQYVHVKNPILNERSTRRLFSTFCEEGLDWSPESCLALLVLALGATATPFEDESLGRKDPETLSHARCFYKAAQKRLGTLIGTPNRVLEAQCFFLSGVCAMTFFQRDIAWRFFLQALACCQQFRFRLLEGSDEQLRASASPIGESSLSVQERSLTTEQAIYWSAWKSERELRRDLQAPDFTLSQAEFAIYPPFFPTPPAIEEERHHGTVDKVHQLSWYFYLSEISLRRLASCIVKGITQFQSSGEPFLEALARATTLHESQAQEWASNLPQLVSIAGLPQDDNICQFVLRGHLMDLYVCIFWPFVDALLRGFRSQSVLEMSLKGLRTHVDTILVNYVGYKHRHHGTSLLLRSCARSALVLVAAALTAKQQGVDAGRSFSMVAGWREAVLLALEMNRYWEAESMDNGFLVRVVQQAWELVEELDGLRQLVSRSVADRRLGMLGFGGIQPAQLQKPIGYLFL
ncbi:hypothetical protein P170DRAFT_504800 [Aspergillus steynii IBT 23096]|uniref:Zn(2)-C6 fungal-type domain-containing protein n=1 Tax=Aspergillus steynii IBT 23096 TaxID=1392250 RepID=A0A2I2GM25_9EURO|nr:uncharacterized protein P170DRAFT_504800 [Aspergillus steynii IBT 23096]PLB53926.1 hypothetical protein P170DRAFT_504800 [Aspergillus steynii IBT 23096]